MSAMVRYGFWAMIPAAAALPQHAAAQTWHGQIRCDAIPGLTDKALVGAFDMHAAGSRLSYSRGVHIADSAALSGITETGGGTLAGAAITLQGDVAGGGYSYTATYQGRLEGDGVVLAGEQVWTGRRLSQPFHRGCRVTLKR